MGLTVTILPNSLKTFDWYTHYSMEEVSYLNHVNSSNKESFIQFVQGGSLQVLNLFVNVLMVKTLKPYTLP